MNHDYQITPLSLSLVVTNFVLMGLLYFNLHSFIGLRTVFVDTLVMAHRAVWPFLLKCVVP
jgi:hypothetical protein